jgi:lantibiotic leader peptide-processing serine protease
MRDSSPKILVLAATAVMLLGGCDDARAPTELAGGDVLPASAAAIEHGRYIVLFSDEQVPADFEYRVAKLGGSVEASLGPIGVVAVTGLTEGAAAELAAGTGVRNVEPDPILANVDDGADASTELAASDALAPADATVSPTSARFYPRQWNMRAVFADKAWAAGHLGSRDVVVAILDTGIDYLHPDLAGLVDLGRSRSFVPEEDVAARYPGRLPISDLFWHGTAVASVVASNATVVAGVNRYVTLLAVKIADSTSAGSVGRLLTGIVYAADQGADVINVSRGHERDKSANPGVVAAFERAANYAFRKGALIISLPFNDAVDLDHNGDMVRFPCEAAHVLCVSATGPTGATGINGPWTDVDAPAPYSGFGRSAVDVAAPGGAGEAGQFRRIWVPCTTTPTATTGAPACIRREAIAQGRGTSFATPTVAGLAALLVAQLGHGNPTLIRARILQSADDLGEPGTDPYYGKGRINIARALSTID